MRLIVIPFIIMLLVAIGCDNQSHKETTEDTTDYSFLDDYDSEVMDSTDTFFMSMEYMEQWRKEYYGYQSSEYDR